MYANAITPFNFIWCYVTRQKAKWALTLNRSSLDGIAYIQQKFLTTQINTDLQDLRSFYTQEFPTTEPNFAHFFLAPEKSMGSEGTAARKLRLLCLHGFRTSGDIIKKQVTGKWPQSVLQKLDLVYVDAPFPCLGKSDVEGIFDPPYYEWFQFNKEFTEYENFDECLDFIQDFMVKNGPFDGLLGFSQGAILSAALPGLQANGVALTKVPKIKVVVIIGGAKLRNQSVVEKAYSSPIPCPSVHFLGDQDFLKQYGTELLDSFVNPLVIRHPRGHTIPRFVEKSLESMLSFLERVQKEVEGTDGQEVCLENTS